MNVTIKESTAVRPSQPTPNLRLCLSNLDLMYPPFYTLAAYVYKSDPSTNFFDTKLLKESLSKVLVTFYPLAGRLALDEKGRREINCNGEGVTFVEAETDCPLGDYADFAANKSKIFPAVDFETHLSSRPLILLQVTRFSCGGVLLGIKAHHNVVDGMGGTHFINSWSDLARGQPVSTVPPVFDRSFLGARHPPTPLYHHAEYDPPPFTPHIQNGQESSSSLFKIPTHFIHFLKSQVNNVKYSTFEILTAHLWRCTTKARNFNSHQLVALIIPTDGRNRLNPDFPKGYSGNVIFYATIMASTRELLSQPLIKTIERIHKILKQMNNNYLRSAIDYLEKKNDGSDQLLNYQGIIELRRESFFINSWVRLPIFDADFGWGRPMNMLPPKLLQGMAVILPCFSGENDIPLIINLQEEHKKSFETLLYM